MQSKATTTKEKYPNKPITCIVPFGAGGAMDLVARMLEKEAVKHLGQPLIIVNKPGSARTLGWNELVTSAPDGNTIGISASELFYIRFMVQRLF
jgi:tripartite-type tricarboxylate transporter receptor subunit TctC